MINSKKHILQMIIKYKHASVSYNYLFLHTTNARLTFWERDPKGGYNKEKPKPSTKQLIRDGLGQIKKEIQLWKDEIIEKYEADPLLVLNPGEIEKKWTFSDNNDLEHWIVTSDKDHAEGSSACSLEINSQGKGIFSGVLSTEVPQDGKIKRSGYCNMRTIRHKKSFQRDAFYDWGIFTHLVLKIRGDGRGYFINLATSGYFDQLWNDSFHYIMFTRGGPYWQIARIPFSKFYFTSKGRIQDLQFPIPLSRITSVGITVSDKSSGPFYLEIDYIGLEIDNTYEETFAYEKYKIPKFLAAN
uniref:NADH:ubiquinone oxidoreductase intermediate-associated protein 30 domain-containing protein n=2 Tax=Clastoptera arizonana TaxID=38151 RepID=A0A1B6C9Z5_9HEMI